MKIEIIKYSELEVSELIKKSAYDNDAGIDIKLIENITIEPHSTLTIGCGFGIKLPAGVMAQMLVRSSMSQKGIVIGNAPIDASYTGEIHLMITNTSDETLSFEKGDRVAQMVILSIITFDLVEKLNVRGSNGLGSSGK